MYMASARGTIVQSILHYKNGSYSALYAFRFFRHIKTPPFVRPNPVGTGVHVKLTGPCIVLHTLVPSALRHSYRGLSCFLMIRSGTLFEGSSGFVLLSKEYKKSEPFPYWEKFGFCCCGASLGARTLGPLIKSQLLLQVASSRGVFP